MEDKLKFVQGLVQTCLLPELKQDIDNIALQTEHFEKYHEVLQTQLSALYDFLQQNEQWLIRHDDPAKKKIYCMLIVLLCELTAPNTIYAISSEKLIKNAKHILQRLAHLERDIDDFMFSYYKEKLHNLQWKRQLGAVHGFAQFLEFYYDASSKRTMSTQWLTFSLSIGLKVRECADTIYKQLGVCIFLKILDHGQKSEIHDLNIHSVIYENVCKDVYNMDTVESISSIWDCLLKCLDNYYHVDSLTWNQCDDMLERVISNATLVSDGLRSICLLQYITKLGYYFTINRQEFESILAGDLTQPATVDECRLVCANNSSYTSFRWAKNILNMLIIVSDKLLQNIEICHKLLIEMHRCYLVCILPIPLRVLQAHLFDFLAKFTSVLMEAIVLHDKDPQVVKTVEHFVTTFYLQLKQSPYSVDTIELTNIQLAYKQLLKSVFNEKFK